MDAQAYPPRPRRAQSISVPARRDVGRSSRKLSTSENAVDGGGHLAGKLVVPLPLARLGGASHRCRPGLPRCGNPGTAGNRRRARRPRRGCPGHADLRRCEPAGLTFPADRRTQAAEQRRRAADWASIEIVQPGGVLLAVRTNQNLFVGAHASPPRAGAAHGVGLARSAAITGHRVCSILGTSGLSAARFSGQQDRYAATRPSSTFRYCLTSRASGIAFTTLQRITPEVSITNVPRSAQPRPSSNTP